MSKRDRSPSPEPAAAAGLLCPLTGQLFRDHGGQVLADERLVPNKVVAKLVEDEARRAAAKKARAAYAQAGKEELRTALKALPNSSWPGKFSDEVVKTLGRVFWGDKHEDWAGGRGEFCQVRLLADGRAQARGAWDVVRRPLVHSDTWIRIHSRERIMGIFDGSRLDGKFALIESPPPARHSRPTNGHVTSTALPEDTIYDWSLFLVREEPRLLQRVTELVPEGDRIKDVDASGRYGTLFAFTTERGAVIKLVGNPQYKHEGREMRLGAKPYVPNVEDDQ
ncbi:hypothetical protein DFJ74DRAFT_770500 [Hyaloraphidium curvatum]|nr:hypothetical protein DFJ74DRAFT_770500 [Hyaloraphidium curvatum]